MNQTIRTSLNRFFTPDLLLQGQTPDRYLTNFRGEVGA